MANSCFDSEEYDINGEAKPFIMKASLLLNLKTTVCASGVVILSIGANNAFLTDTTPSGGVFNLSYVAFTSAEVRGDPS